MELTESIESLNVQLVDLFGIDTSANLPMWRIVWSEDQYEKRRIADGLLVEVPKYPYIRERFVLERLVAVPEFDQEELPMKLSYEPMWRYENGLGEPIPPTLWASKFIIDTIYAAIGKKSLAKYIEPEKDTTVEGQQERIRELQLELFGNETEVGDALAYKQGIVVPGEREKK